MMPASTCEPVRVARGAAPITIALRRRGVLLDTLTGVDLEEIRREFWRFAPAYAQEEAEAALDKVIELQAQRVLRTGLYYIVLVDLVASTKFMVEHGNDRAAKRIQFFVQSASTASCR